MYDEDEKMIRELRNYSAKKRKTFNSVINSKTVSEDELDEWFLG